MTKTRDLLSPRLAAGGGFDNPRNFVVRRHVRRFREKLRRGEYRFVEVDCPLCGSAGKTVVAEADSKGFPLEVSVCATCGAVYTNLRLDDRSLGEFYNAEYRPTDRGYEGDPGRFFEFQRTKAPRILEAFRNVVGELPPSLVVGEIGSGAGGICFELARMGHTAVGCDIGREYLEYGRGRGVRMVEGDSDALFDTLDREGLVPDLVVYEQVLEHLPDPVEEMSRLGRRLRMGKHVFVGVPGLESPAPRFADFREFIQLPHLVHFDQETLAYVMGLGGFREVGSNPDIQAIYRREEGVRVDLPRRSERNLVLLREREVRFLARTAYGSPGYRLRTMGRWLTVDPETILREIRYRLQG